MGISNTQFGFDIKIIANIGRCRFLFQLNQNNLMSCIVINKDMVDIMTTFV